METKSKVQGLILTSIQLDDININLNFNFVINQPLTLTNPRLEYRKVNIQDFL